MTVSDLDEVRAVKGARSGVYDVLGVGFGPSNLALAATIEEEAADLAWETLFLERREAFTWHPGMLLEGARIQLSFLKDLVTLRNPQSRYTFLKYLQAKGRLDRFINLRTFYPSRIEFCDYYGWVAEQLADHVRYRTEVTAVRPVASGGPSGSREVELIEVEARPTGNPTGSGQPSRYLTRNLVLAVGGTPHVPAGIDLSACTRAYHSQDFLQRTEELFPDRGAAHRFLVVGSGQTAAEIFQVLYRTYPNAEVTAAVRRFAYKPADDSHFVNEIFFPGMVGLLYRLDPDVRREVLATHMDTNYSAVDGDLIHEIYDALYEREVVGDTRVCIRTFLELRGLEQRGDRVIARFHDRSRGCEAIEEADAAVLATGFERPRLHSLLRPLEPWLLPSDGGGWEVSRNFRLRTTPDFRPGVFLQGFCESTHGLSDTLLSTLPIRAQEILSEIAAGPGCALENAGVGRAG